MILYLSIFFFYHCFNPSLIALEGYIKNDSENAAHKHQRWSSSLFAALVSNSKNDREDDAQNTNDDVGVGQSEVGAAHKVGSGEHELLSAAIRKDVVRVSDFNTVNTSFHTVVVSTVQFAEVGKTSRAHPHDKVLVGDVSPLDFIPVNVVKAFEFVSNVRLPCNVGVVHYKWGFSFPVADWVSLGMLNHFESVGEQRLGNQTTGVGRCWLDKSGLTVVSLGNVGSQVWVFNDRVTVGSEIFDGLSNAHQLLVGATTHVASMVLVEVGQLVVSEDLSSDGSLDIELFSALNRLTVFLGFTRR